MAADLTISVSLDGTLVKRGAAGVKSQIKSIGDEAEKSARRTNSLAKLDFSALGNQLRNVGSQISGFGQSLTLAVSAPIAALATLGVRFNATKEQALVAFGVLLKSGEKAKILFADLQKFAADTPFEMPEISQSTKSLLAFGVAQEKILPTLKSIGDIASGTGVPLSELAEIYGKAKVQGRLFSEDINQLTGRGIPIIQELAKQFGVSETEVKKLVESGKVGFPQLEKAFADLTNEGGQFSGMMEAQSKTFTGRLSTLMDAVNTSLGNITEPLFNALSGVMPSIIGFVEQVSSAFTNLSPTMQIVISAILGVVAAIGPALVIIGTIIGIIGGFIGSISTAAIAVGGFVVLAKIVGIALLAIIPIAVQVGLWIVALGLAAYTLYQLWTTNFGGIQTYTISAFNAIRQIIQTVMTAVYGFVQTIGGQIVGWWQANYPLIRQTVENVSNQIKSIVQAFLNAVQTFWENHGERITKYISTVWNLIKSVVGIAIEQVGNFIRLGLQILNGDWSGAWQTFLKTIQTAARLWGTIVLQGLHAIGRFLMASIPVVIEYGVKFQTTIVQYIGKAIAATVVVVATLPQRLVTLVPQFIAAGKSLAGAFWQGLKDVFSGETVSGAISGGIGVTIGKEVSGGISGNLGGATRAFNNLGKAAKAVGGNVKNAVEKALTPIQELRKEVEEAQKAFEFLAFNKEAQDLRVASGLYREASSDLEELLNLRAKLGKNSNLAVPTLPVDIKAEIAGLKEYEEGLGAGKKRAEEFAVAKANLIKQGAGEIIQLSEQLRLFGAGDEVDQQRIRNQFDLARARGQWINDGFSEKEIEKLTKILQLDQARIVELVEQLKVKKQIADTDKVYQDITNDLNNEIAELNNQLAGGIELSKADAIAKLLQTEAYQNLTPKMKKAIEAKAVEIDQLRQAVKAQDEYREAFNRTADIFEDALTKLSEGNWKGLFDSILQEMKRFLIRAAAEWLASKFFKLISANNNGSGNETGGGFSIGNILKGLFGGGSSSSGGFSFGSRNSSSSNSGLNIQTLGGLANQDGTPFKGDASSSGGGSSAAGIAAAISVGANILGGLIGGKAGSVISAVGSGIGIGATIGSIIPGLGTVVGAVIGGAIGFFSSIFGSKKRKVDKQENLPNLQKGFSEAFDQLKQLSSDKNALFNDPEGTIEKAKSLRQQIASGFGIKFQSKKYSNIAQQQIAQKTAEADRIIKELEAMRDQAVTARTIDEQLNANFATGVYMDTAFLRQYSQYRRRNGMLGGVFNGQDTLPSMLANGEMVLNPMQISAVINNAGGVDVFKGSGIPNYATGVFVGGNSQPQATSAAPSARAEKQPIIVKIFQNNSGIVESDILDVVIDGLNDDYEIQTELVKSYDKTKRRVG